MCKEYADYNERQLANSISNAVIYISFAVALNCSSQKSFTRTQLTRIQLTYTQLTPTQLTSHKLSILGPLQLFLTHQHHTRTFSDSFYIAKCPQQLKRPLLKPMVLKSFTDTPAQHMLTHPLYFFSTDFQHPRMSSASPGSKRSSVCGTRLARLRLYDCPRELCPQF